MFVLVPNKLTNCTCTLYTEHLNKNATYTKAEIYKCVVYISMNGYNGSDCYKTFSIFKYKM